MEIVVWGVGERGKRFFEFMKNDIIAFIDKDIKKAIEQREARWKEEIGYKDKDVVEAYLALPTAQKKIIRETIIEFSKVK